MPPTLSDTHVDRAHPARIFSPCSGFDNGRRFRRLAGAGSLFSLMLAPAVAQASFFAGEALDKMADILTWVVICFVPIAVIVIFWLVHILPEKIAEKRHHPQKTAIKTLCLLSLVFGGMLWPLAWLWAYMKPVGYKLAYGTDKHEDYFRESAEQAEKGEIAQSELEAIRQELDDLAARGQLTPELRSVQQRLAGLIGGTAPEAPRAASEAAAVGAASAGKAD